MNKNFTLYVILKENKGQKLWTGR